MKRAGFVRFSGAADELVGVHAARFKLRGAHLEWFSLRLHSRGSLGVFGLLVSREMKTVLMV